MWKQLFKTCHFTLRFQRYTLFIGLRFFIHTIYLTTCTWLNLSRISFSFTNKTLFIFLCSNRIIKSIFNLLWWAGITEVHIDNGNTHVVGFNDRLKLFPYTLTRYFTAVGKYVVHFRVANYVANSAIKRLT